jgi:hypothetical protein
MFSVIGTPLTVATTGLVSLTVVSATAGADPVAVPPGIWSQAASRPVMLNISVNVRSFIVVVL